MRILTSVSSMIFLPLFVGATLCSGAALACENGSTILFQCTAKYSSMDNGERNYEHNGKQIEVCDAGKTINYSFGKPAKKPELAIAVKRDDVTTWQWKGIGRYETYSVNIPSNKFLYNVFWSHDRIKHTIEAGVRVEKNYEMNDETDEMLKIYCKEDSIKVNLVGVDLKEVDLK